MIRSMTMMMRNRKGVGGHCFLPFFMPILHVEFRPKLIGFISGIWPKNTVLGTLSSFRFFISFITILMTRSENQTTIAISRIHYEALQNLGHKNETFDQIVGKLLKNANLEPLK